MPFYWVELPWAPSAAMRRSKLIAKLSDRLGLPISTGMNASVEALRNLKAKTIVIATAYMEKINQAVKRYYEDAGFQALGIAGLEVKRPVDQVKLPIMLPINSLFQQNPSVDAILIQGRWRSVGLRGGAGKR